MAVKRENRARHTAGRSLLLMLLGMQLLLQGPLQSLALSISVSPPKVIQSLPQGHFCACSGCPGGAACCCRPTQSRAELVLMKAFCSQDLPLSLTDLSTCPLPLAVRADIPLMPLSYLPAVPVSAQVLSWPAEPPFLPPDLTLL